MDYLYQTLALPELSVPFPFFDKLLMGSPFADFPFFHDNDLVAFDDCRKPVSYDYCGYVAAQLVYRIMDGPFGNTVQTARRFVENEDLRMIQNSPGQGYPLPLTTG